MNTKSNKIDLLLRELKVTRSEFIDRVGVSSNTFANWRKRELGINVINKIVNAFPQVSYEWLATGEGNVFGDADLSYSDNKNTFNQNEITKRINELISEGDLTPGDLAMQAKANIGDFVRKLTGKQPWTVKDINKICENMGVRKGWLVDGEGQKFKAPDEVLDTIPIESSRYKDKNMIPLIPTNAMAGRLSGDDVQIMPYDIETFFVLPTFAKSDFCIRVEGKSMEPTYQKGDIVACKYVPMSGTFFQWGKVYVLATDQGVLVKHIEKGSDNEHVKLISDNPEFKPFEVPVSGIYSVAIINGLIRVE